MTSETDNGAGDAGDEIIGAEIIKLTIQKWTCEEAIDAAATYDDLTLACGPSLEASTWQLNQIPTDSETGLVIWNNPGSGELIVSLETSAGDSESAVYCEVEPIDADALEPQVFQVENGEIVIDVAAPSEVYCNWFVHE